MRGGIIAADQALELDRVLERVVILGGGIAGLTTAYELGKAGYIPLFVSGHWNAEEEKRELRAGKPSGSVPEPQGLRAGLKGLFGKTVKRV